MRTRIETHEDGTQTITYDDGRQQHIDRDGNPSDIVNGMQYEHKRTSDAPDVDDGSAPAVVTSASQFSSTRAPAAAPAPLTRTLTGTRRRLSIYNRRPGTPPLPPAPPQIETHPLFGGSGTRGRTDTPHPATRCPRGPLDEKSENKTGGMINNETQRPQRRS
ncbi:MAG: hypothetical protein P1U34_07295 [Coxiellaceae bacterium]|nr:hypothetical protein [Coxiellaceae bacterium]